MKSNIKWRASGTGHERRTLPATDTRRTSPAGCLWVLARRKRVRTPKKRGFQLKPIFFKNEKELQKYNPPPTKGQRRESGASRQAQAGSKQKCN